MPASLYIVRHGIAAPHGTPGILDSQRPLTPKGVERTTEIGQGLSRLRLDIERIVTSPLPRARRTAELIAEELGLIDQVEIFDGLSAGATPRAIRDWLATRAEERLMIVGHNPDLTDLVALLIGLTGPSAPFELRKGGVAALEADPSGGYTLDWLTTPRLLRRLAVN
ncbi:MAG: phosphohistidine phosphatase SixA [Isosphaeraceae bacterium]